MTMVPSPPRDEMNLTLKSQIIQHVNFTYDKNIWNFQYRKACTKIQHPAFSFSVLTLMKKFFLKAEKIIKNTQIKFYT